MTTSTTDAEAIARIIGRAMLDNPTDGKFSERVEVRKERASVYADEILSYLASRREAQEPIQITMQDVRLMAGEGPLSAKDTLAGVNAHLRMLHRRTAPPSPAPAGEVERLREALTVLTNAVANMRVPQTVEDVALQVTITIGPALEAARAALNGGRHD